MIPHRCTNSAWCRLASEFEMGSGACDYSMVLSGSLCLSYAHKYHRLEFTRLCKYHHHIPKHRIRIINSQLEMNQGKPTTLISIHRHDNDTHTLNRSNPHWVTDRLSPRVRYVKQAYPLFGPFYNDSEKPPFWPILQRFLKNRLFDPFYNDSLICSALAQGKVAPYTRPQPN